MLARVVETGSAEVVRPRLGPDDPVRLGREVGARQRGREQREQLLQRVRQALASSDIDEKTAKSLSAWLDDEVERAWWRPEAPRSCDHASDPMTQFDLGVKSAPDCTP
jgi:hypothetical protein